MLPNWLYTILVLTDFQYIRNDLIIISNHDQAAAPRPQNSDESSKAGHDNQG